MLYLILDGWTRDQVPVYIECINKPLLPELGTKIKIIVTYVKSITTFYGHLKMKRTEKNSHIGTYAGGLIVIPVRVVSL